MWYQDNWRISFAFLPCHRFRHRQTCSHVSTGESCTIQIANLTSHCMRAAHFCNAYPDGSRRFSHFPTSALPPTPSPSSLLLISKVFSVFLVDHTDIHLTSLYTTTNLTIFAWQRRKLFMKEPYTNRHRSVSCNTFPQEGIVLLMNK